MPTKSHIHTEPVSRAGTRTTPANDIGYLEGEYLRIANTLLAGLVQAELVSAGAKLALFRRGLRP